MRLPLTFCVLLCLVVFKDSQLSAFTPAPQLFQQETATNYGSLHGLNDKSVLLIEAGDHGWPRAFSGGRWQAWDGNRWLPIPGIRASATNEFVLPDARGGALQCDLPWPAVRHFLRTGTCVWIASAKGIWEAADQPARRLETPFQEVFQLARSKSGDLWAATGNGLWSRPSGASWQRLEIMDEFDRDWAAGAIRGVAFDVQDQLWIATRAGVARRSGTAWRFFTGAEGLPYNDFTGITPGPGGKIWFGTRLGAILFDDGSWHYRQGLRWLPADEVRQIFVDTQDRAWFATAGGVGLIEHKSMSLAAKANFYNSEIDRYVRRTEFGYVAEAQLRQRAEKASANPQDSDNDGLWTGMYGAAQALGYAATGDPAARQRAKQAFEALRFLQKVTQGGSPSPPKGYVARTIRSSQLPDPNQGRLEDDQRQRDSGDKLWKVYAPRWPKSADGKWYWKSDTSSDELDGHFFFYPLYYDFCADSEAEKQRVREVVGDLMDHMLDHGYVLLDHDGTPTRWAVYAPEALNHDANWWYERGLKSLSMLSYLASAHHVTGNSRYAQALRELVERHAFGQNAMVAKIQQGFGSGNQSDDEMAFMCYYNLLRYSPEERLRELIRYSLYSYWAIEQPEMNPFFNFVCAAHNLNRKAANPFGVFNLSPWQGWLEDSMATLYGFPVDRLDWGHRNSHRLDLIRLPLQQSIDLYEPRPGRGYRVNGKVLPVENRHFNHWNTDPWQLDYGGDGHELAAGTVFLLPYYLGLYHGFIAPEKTAPSPAEK